MFYRAGLNLGDRLLGPSPGNPRGYFEDRDFLEFHDDLLGRLGTTMYLDRPMSGELHPEQRARAAALVAARADRLAWGWKDPRTVLFLELWHDIVPAARYLFIYRRPAEVVDSLRRRGDRELQLRYPGAALLARIGVPRFRVQRTLRLWLDYNEPIAAFAESHRAQCQVVRLDRLAIEIDSIAETLRAAGMPLRADVDLAAMIEPNLLCSATASIERRCRASRPAAALLERLDALA